MYRNSVRPVADLELKGEWSAAKDLERARIGRGEGGGGRGGRERKPKVRRGAQVAGVEVWQSLAAEKGSQKGKILNSS